MADKQFKLPDGLVDSVPNVARGEAQLLTGMLRGQGSLGQELLADERVPQHAEGQAPRWLLRGILYCPGWGRLGVAFETGGGMPHEPFDQSREGASLL